jgi:hypothetical protein
MRRALMATTLAASLSLLAGCSGSDPGLVAKASNPDTSPKASSSTEPAATDDANPLEGLSAQQVLAKSKAAAKDAKSFHTTAKMLDGKDHITVNLKMTSTGKAYGVIIVNGDKIAVRRLGKTLYFKGSRSFWKTSGGAQVADLMAGKWLMVKQGTAKEMDEFFELTDTDAFLDETLKLTAAQRKGLKLVKGIDVDGQKTVGLKDTVGDAKSDTDKDGILYVADAEAPLPLQFAVKNDDSQYMKFKEWNETVSVVVPKGAIDMATLGG